MNISMFSVVMSVLWFDVMVAFLSYMRRKTKFLAYWSLGPLLAIILLSMVRLFVPLDTTGSLIIRSRTLLPAITAFLESEHVIFADKVQTGSLLLLLWGVVSVALALYFLYRVVKSEIALFRMTPTGLPAQLHALGLPENIVKRVIVTDTMITPCMCGFIRPCILLPKNAADFSAQQLDYIIRHEWQHFRNGDLWIKLALRLFTCAFWWNPVNRLLLNDVDQILELRCDKQMSVHLGLEQQLDYLDTLIFITKQHHFSQPRLVTAGLVSGEYGAELTQRVQLVLKEKKKLSFLQICAISLAGLALFCLSYSVIFQPIIPDPIPMAVCISVPKIVTLYKLEIHIFFTTTTNILPRSVKKPPSI